MSSTSFPFSLFFKPPVGLGLPLQRFLAVLIVLGATVNGGRGEPNGPELPRFASLAYDQVNMRVGPMRIFPVKWQYRRQGLPVEVVNEREDWREIRDHQGVQGWVHRSQLSSRRSVIIVAKQPVPLRTVAAEDGYIVAFLAPNVVGQFRQCDGLYCEVALTSTAKDRYQGWVKRNQIWGVEEGE